MFTRDTPHCGIDSIYCAEIRMKRPVPGGRMHVNVKMVYANKEAGETFGTCPLRYDSMIHSEEGVGSPLSDESVALLKKFMESAEKDLGKLVFEHGRTTDESVKAEADGGLDTVGLGGQT